MILHEFPVSSNAQRVRFLLFELGLEFERNLIPPAKPRPDSHLALNPLGLVPVLQDGDLTLAESNAILRYLAAKAGRDDLYPADLAARAQVDMLLDAIATSFRPNALPLEITGLGFKPGVGFFPETAEPERVPEVLEQQRPVLDAISRMLGPEPWAVHGRFTIADCSGAPVLWRLLNVPGFADAFPRLAAWGRAVTSRPAFSAIKAESGIQG